jgi:trk system potassium uptake protein TrkH
MPDLRPVLWGLGLLLTLFALALALPALTDALQGDPDWPMFLAVSGLSLFAGLMLVLANLNHPARGLSVRQAILLVVSGWLLLALVAALPFHFGRLHLSVTDALFEATGGITATDATVLRHLENASPGILLWRALLQWLGGFAAVTLGVLVLPAFNVGGMELFRTDVSSLDDPLAYRGARLMTGIGLIYLGLTALLALLLWLAGIAAGPALLQAMSAISCGGFATSDRSIGVWHNAAADWVILLGMLLGGAPFLWHWQLARRQWRVARHNSQIRWYVGLIVTTSLAITLWLVVTQDAKPLPALRHSLFAVTSVMTGTGYATLDWSRWTGFPLVMLFLLTFVGGCAGSTAGGIKVFRLQVLLANARLQLLRLLRPNAVLLPRFEGRTIPERLAESVLGFLFVYTLSFALLALALGFVGMGFPTAIAAAASALANLGPGIIPQIGPLASYGQVPEAAKWLLAAGMLFGRLEMFILLALFNRAFWRD